MTLSTMGWLSGDATGLHTHQHYIKVKRQRKGERERKKEEMSGVNFMSVIRHWFFRQFVGFGLVSG